MVTHHERNRSRRVADEVCYAIFHTFVAFEGDTLRPLHLRDEALDLRELVADLEVRRLERDGLLEALLRHVLVEGAPGG